MARFLNGFNIVGVFSMLTLATAAVVPIQAAATIPAANHSEQIVRFAHEAYYNANAIAKREYQKNVRQELGRFGRGDCPAVLAYLVELYAENLVNLLIPATRTLSKEKALVFWTEVEKDVIRTIESCEPCRKNSSVKQEKSRDVSLVN